MKKANLYLQQKILFPPQIMKKPSLNLGIIVVIPCYNEPYLLLTLMALKKCDLPDCDVEVIVVINDSDADSKRIIDQNQKSFDDSNKWLERNNSTRLKFHIIYKGNIGRKNAGVGLARKIGMDEACIRFDKIRNQKGIILGFDADSRCDKNYFTEIESYFINNPKSPAASIHFEHPLAGMDFEEDIYEAITLYELHLRYYVVAKKWLGFPFATQTIGSSMAVRADAYQQQGGMNKRKAGEDFYFLHKFTPLGKYGEIRTTKVIPSPRKSDRVPFGTGKAVGEIIKDKSTYKTYNPDSFKDLKLFFDKLPILHKTKKEDLEGFKKSLPEVVTQFLDKVEFDAKVVEIQSNTTNFPKFKNRFFRWFNAFMIMKFLHFSRDQYHESASVIAAAKWLLTELKINFLEQETPKALLLVFRNLAKDSTLTPR